MTWPFPKMGVPPKMDGLQWKILLKLGGFGGIPISGNPQISVKTPKQNYMNYMSPRVGRFVGDTYGERLRIIKAGSWAPPNGSNLMWLEQGHYCNSYKPPMTAWEWYGMVHTTSSNCAWGMVYDFLALF